MEDARALYKALGLDPTKTRPSNEALLRRVLKGEALYTHEHAGGRAQPLLAAGTAPFGLYDLDRVEPPVELRRGGPGESYEGIRKAAVNVDARPCWPTPGARSATPPPTPPRTMITLDTRAPGDRVCARRRPPTSRVEGVLERTAATLVRYSGGNVVDLRVP